MNRTDSPEKLINAFGGRTESRPLTGCGPDPTASAIGVLAAKTDTPPTDAPANVPVATPEDLLATATSLINPPDIAQLMTLLERLVSQKLEPLLEHEILVAIKTATGKPLSILEKQLNEMRCRRSATNDLAEEPIRPQWSSLLRLDRWGLPERNEASVLTAFAHDMAFAEVLVFDEFSQEISVVRSLPWEEVGSTLPRTWGEPDDVRCAEWLQRHEINVSPVIVRRSVIVFARNIRIHPVRRYLRALSWDGKPRLDSWVVRYLGAADTDLNRAFGLLWMISAVARIMKPGVKADHMLILEGPQGIRKSTALKVLASEPWFTDELAELGSKDAAQQTRGVWIIEMAELDAIAKADVPRIKSFLTRTIDRYRPPYEPYVVTVPRQCIFAGSVNADTYLRDETGNRRFWPIRCGEIDLPALHRDRDQLWAEAVARFDAGAIWWLENEELVASAGVAQEARYEADAWDVPIERWLVCERQYVDVGVTQHGILKEQDIPRARPLTDVSVAEILEQALRIEPAKWTRADQMRVGKILKSKNWVRYRTTAKPREWRYEAPQQELQ